MSEATTVQIPKKLKNDLDSFKDFEKETYANVITKLIDIARKDEEFELELTNETLKGIKEAREDIKKGRIYTSKQIKNELGL